MILQDFAGFERVSVSFSDFITYLVGPNTAGKTRVGLYGPQSIFQGISEKAERDTTPIKGKRFKFITIGADKAVNSMVLRDEENGCDITVTRTIETDGTKLKFNAPKDYPKPLNQLWLNNLFNQYLISPKEFSLLSPLEQAKALDIDTSKFDAQLVSYKNDYTDLNRIIKSYANLVPVEETKAVDVQKLQNQIKGLREIAKEQLEAYKIRFNKAKENYKEELESARRDIDNFNQTQEINAKSFEDAYTAFYFLQGFGCPEESLKPIKDYIDVNFLKVVKPKKLYSEIDLEEPEYDETIGRDDEEIFALQEQITKAVQINMKAAAYDEYVKSKNKLAVAEADLEKNKKDQEEVIEMRKKYLAGLNLGVPDIDINDAGELVYQGRLIKEPFLSSGELIKVVIGLISSRHPDFKYVFLQDFILLDYENQQKVLNYLYQNGFQIVIEWVGTSALEGQNCIVLKNGEVIESTVVQ